jgi:glycosyltransferase involved in cell wall biosynthesis
MTPLRVLLVDHAPIIGGVEVMLRDLLANLDPARVAATIATDIHSPMRGQFHPTLPEMGLPLPRLNRNPKALLDWLAAGIGLARAARQSRAQLIQTFTARTHLISVVAGSVARLPVVWRLNDDTLPRSAARFVGRVPRRLIAVSAYLRDYYSGMLRVTDLIPDGLPLPPLQSQAEARRALNLPLDAFIVVHVARLVRWKGQAVFLRALSRLPEARGLVVGGASPADDVPGPLGGGESYRRELEALAHSLDVFERVMFMGHQSNIAPRLAAADVVAHTSTLPEPFGRVVVEAMAQGRPVVAARAGGILDIVEPNVTGLLTPPGDADALATALRTLQADASLREQLGRAGRARAEREFSVTNMTERFTQLWTETV